MRILKDFAMSCTELIKMFQPSKEGSWTNIYIYKKLM
jgi:hypothetical protein